MMGLALSNSINSNQKVMDEPINLQQWMTLLREDIRKNVAIIYLAIPGSHNSMTFDITRKSKLAPDAEHVIRRIYRFLPWFVSRWAKTQKYTVTDQLKNGIRFFDLRVSKLEYVPPSEYVQNTAKDTYYFVHGLYSGPVSRAIEEINEFLEDNPGELVILDFQHFYDIGNKDHYLMYRMLKKVFGDKMYGPQDGKLAELTLTKAYKQGKQVVVIYRGNFLAPEYWSGGYWPTPWPQTADLKVLKNFLDTTLQQRSQDIGWVSQCVLTPDAKYIGIRPFKTLKYTAKEVIKHFKIWISDQIPGNWENDEVDVKRVNVIIADFIDLKNSTFATTVISLNNKIPVISNDVTPRSEIES